MELSGELVKHPRKFQRLGYEVVARDVLVGRGGDEEAGPD